MASLLDIETLTAPVSADDPAGPDLAYDAAFGEFERIAAGTPARSIGESVKPAEPPEWPEVFARGQELLARSKDLRIAVPLTEATLRLHGIPGLASGLALIRRLLSDHWEGLYPQLDADDTNDPTDRVNRLLPLADPAGILDAIRTVTIVSSPAAGRFSYRDCQIAAGEIQIPEGSDQPAIEPGLIDAAFSTAEIDSLQATAGALRAAQEEIRGIESLLAEKLSTSQLPQLGPLGDLLKAMSKIMTSQLARLGVGDATADDAGEAPGAHAAARSASGEVRSREDVTRTLDRLCLYFEQNEPSSPVPLLLRRAKRLVAADFMAILRDLTPEGVSQAELISGVRAEGKN